MYKNVYAINADGFLAEVYLIGFDKKGNPVDPLPELYTMEDPPPGLYRARWVEGGWAEDMTEEEIWEISNQPQEPCMGTRLDVIENVVLDMLE